MIELPEGMSLLPRGADERRLVLLPTPGDSRRPIGFEVNQRIGVQLADVANMSDTPDEDAIISMSADDIPAKNTFCINVCFAILSYMLFSDSLPF